MTITGFLSDFSLPELFWFLGQGRRTGRLTVCTLPESSSTPAPCYYIWVEQGCIVAVTNRLDEQGLISLIAQQGWVSQCAIAKLRQWSCPIHQPLGCCLITLGILQNEQLHKLFLIQISQPLSELLQLHEGHFQFEPNAPLPRREMTGLSIPLKSLGNYSQTTVSRLRRLMQFNQLSGRESGVSQDMEFSPWYLDAED